MSFSRGIFKRFRDMNAVIYKHEWERARRSEVIRKQRFQTVLKEERGAVFTLLC